MKLTNLVRAAAILAFFAALLINAYSNYKSMESYDKMRSSMNDLKNKLCDMRATANCLSRKLCAQKETPAFIESAPEKIISL